MNSDTNERSKVAKTIQAAVLVGLVAAAAYVWSEGESEDAIAQVRDPLRSLVVEKANALKDEYGALCAEVVISEPDGERRLTGFASSDPLSAELVALVEKSGASATSFAERHNYSDKLILLSATPRRDALDARKRIVIEAVELHRLSGGESSSLRWEVARSEILYLCNPDGSPRQP